MQTSYYPSYHVSEYLTDAFQTSGPRWLDSVQILRGARKLGCFYENLEFAVYQQLE